MCRVRPKQPHPLSSTVPAEKCSNRLAVSFARHLRISKPGKLPVPKVLELQCRGKVLGSNCRDDRPPFVPTLAGYGNPVVLNLGRIIELPVAEEGRGRLGDIRGEALLGLDHLPRRNQFQQFMRLIRLNLLVESGGPAESSAGPPVRSAKRFSNFSFARFELSSGDLLSRRCTIALWSLLQEGNFVPTLHFNCQRDRSSTPRCKGSARVLRRWFLV